MLDSNQSLVNTLVDQANQCSFASECKNNYGGINAISNENGQTSSVNVGQTNKCFRHSSCGNDGAIDSTGRSNQQSNLCVNGASCKNSGTDNDTTCVHNVACNNSGTDTRVVGQSANCNSIGNNTSTYCQPGRTISIPNS